MLGEQERIEAKTGQEIGKSILETICAFANEPHLGGGYLLLGLNKSEDKIENAYQVVGVKNPEKLLEDLVSQCRTTFNKPIQIETEQVLIEKKIVIGIFVPEANNGNKPVYFKSQGLPQGACRRIGTSDIRCTEDDLLMLFRNRDIDSFDYTVLDDAEWEDIDLDAVKDYRTERSLVHSTAEELRWSDEDLLQSLGCLKRVNKKIKPTVAGILLFGTSKALRRLFPTMRVEYIRESGTRWMSDIENRYTAVEIRAPLLQTIRRALSAVMDDLPKAFSLPEGSAQREDIPIIPYAVIREAIVNAVMHRNYRVHQAVQIIRYANRIEIRNPGYSLVADDHLGEPGSKSRNPKIAETLHETRFAEMKGSGIRIMRENMQEVGLTPPFFESDRGRDLFVATFLFHHFLSDEDISWLSNFKSLQLTDAQARTLIFVREVGAIDNAAYRNLNQVDTLTASISLRKLRDLGLLIAKNQGVATYYIPGEGISKRQVLEDKEHQLEGKTHQLEGKTHQLEGKTHQLEGKTHQLEGKTHQLEGKTHQLEGKTHQLGDKEHQLEGNLLDLELPQEVQEILAKVGKKVKAEQLREAIITLCEWNELTAIDLAFYLKRDKRDLVRKFLTPLVTEGLLTYKYPQMVGHPKQAYRRANK